MEAKSSPNSDLFALLFCFWLFSEFDINFKKIDSNHKFKVLNLTINEKSSIYDALFVDLFCLIRIM